MTITLLKKGSLIANDPSKQTEYDKMVPIDLIMEWVKKAMESPPSIQSRVLVLQSDTGSGKSTAIPPTLYNRFFAKDHTRVIAVTQPKIINTINIVKDQIVASGYYPYMKLGENIGWATSVNKKIPKYGLIYMTIGVLSQQMRSMTDEEFIHRYSIIIIDEVHESTIDQAILLFMLKNFLMRNQNNSLLPVVILTSATLDTEKFLNYFGVNNDEKTNLIRVRGFTYPLTEHWDMTKTTSNYIETMASYVSHIHNRNLNDELDNCDILIFMPGAEEMLQLEVLLKEVNNKLFARQQPMFLVLKLDGEAVKKNTLDYISVFTDITNLVIKVGTKDKPVYVKPMRRVILSTSVAETGITINTLKYVIDSGFHKGPAYIPYYNVSGIVTTIATKSRVKQRMGRANRKAPGEFYPVYPKYVYDNFRDMQYSEIILTDISKDLLDILFEYIKHNKDTGAYIELDKIGLIDNIPDDILSVAIEKLYVLGFISPDSTYLYKMKATTNTNKSTYLDIIENILQNTYMSTGLSTSLQTGLQTNEQTTTNCQTQPVAEPLESDKVNFVDLYDAEPTIVTGPPRFNLTKMGALATFINVKNILPEHIKIIFAAFAWEVSVIDMITIAAYLALEVSDFYTERPNWNFIFNQGLPTYFTGRTSAAWRAPNYVRVKKETLDLANRVPEDADELQTPEYDLVKQPIENEEGLFRAQMLIADDFINGLCLFYACENVMLDHPENTLYALKEYCVYTKLKYTGVIEFFRKRDELINKFVQIGFDPWRNEQLRNAPSEDFSDLIFKIKQCIYEGYQLSVATLNPKDLQYYTATNLPIVTPKLLAQNELTSQLNKKYNLTSVQPKKIIYDKLNFKLDKVKNIYVIKAPRVSSMN